MSQVLELRKDLGLVVADFAISRGEKDQFSDLLDNCNELLRNGEQLGAEGCCWLLRVWKSYTADADDISRLSRAMVEQARVPDDILNSIRYAARAMVALTRTCRSNDKGDAFKRSWTQTELDQAIIKLRHEHQGTYDAAKKGDPDARKKAQEIFGRNKIAKALRVGGAAMVSKSPIWQEIAEAVGMRHGPRGEARPAQNRVGLAQAMEEKAQASGDTVSDDVLKRELLVEIEVCIESKPEGTELARQLEALKVDLETGKNTVDEASEILDLLRTQ